MVRPGYVDGMSRHADGCRIASPLRITTSCRRVSDEIAFDPDHDQVGKPPDLFIRQFSATWDMVPFLYASPAACGGGMLGREHRMPTPGRLFAVLHGIGGTNS